MEPIQKKEQVADSAVKASASAQSGASKKKVQKAPNAFRTISEVATELDVQQHVLRFWETKFTQVKPLKRGGGRRYYRPEDVAILKRIHHLLYTEGYTIKGVQKLLKGRGKSQVVAAEANNENAARDVAPAPQPKVQAPVQAQATAEPAGMSAKQRAVLEMMLAELKSLRSMVKA
ncbi:MAG: MerR family transcriptional regulator [Micavibrio sp.]|nr:MerR family transcriptional regulator [Micavibrio sp.]